MKPLKKFIINGAVLSLGSIIINAVDSAFTIYLSGKIGADGIGLFQLVMSVYRFGVTLALSGISLGTTRVVAEELSVGNELGAARAAKRSILLSLFFGTLSFLLLFSFSEFISVKLLSNRRTLLSLRWLSVSLPFIAVSSALGGYFTAVRRVTKSTAGQFFSYFIRISVSIYFISLFVGRDIEYMTLSVVFGGLFSEIAYTLYLFILFLLDKKRYKKKGEGGERLTKRILSISLPVAVSSYFRSAFFTLEQLLIPIGLKKFSGDGSFSLAGYGLVRGMVMPVLLFPSAFIYSFSSLLVPELSECVKLGNKKKQNRIIERALKTTLIFGIGVSAFIYFFAPELSILLYNSTSSAYFLQLLAPLCAFMYLDGVVDNLLKGVGEEMSVMRYNIVDSALSAFLVWVLVPFMGIDGYVVVILVSEIFNTFLSLRRLIRVCEIRGFLGKITLILSATALSLAFISKKAALNFPIGAVSIFILAIGAVFYTASACFIDKKHG